jgi:hypothetical protein
MSTHLDHGLSPEHLTWVQARVAEHTAFFMETVELPAELPPLDCALYGPMMQDEPVPESDVVYQVRGNRSWASRMVDRPLRPTRLISIIAGPDHIGYPDWRADVAPPPMILYTAFGGPAAPKEPGDPTLEELADLFTSRAFWRIHALSTHIGG